MAPARIVPPLIRIWFCVLPISSQAEIATAAMGIDRPPGTENQRGASGILRRKTGNARQVAMYERSRAIALIAAKEANPLYIAHTTPATAVIMMATYGVRKRT